jgi:hypothetical protein
MFSCGWREKKETKKKKKKRKRKGEGDSAGLPARGRAPLTCEQSKQKKANVREPLRTVEREREREREREAGTDNASAHRSLSGSSSA